MFRRCSIKQFVLVHLSAEEAEKFALWAFGSDYSEMSSLCLMREWNRRHGDWISVRGSDTVADSIEEMVKIWKLCESCHYTT
jgi:hypothetical protein